ncbi:MAG: response regulator [Balneolaceae bacterium]|nr:response regulator [Balneolaceae bacterium]
MKKRKILIVEDEMIIALMLEQMVIRQGHVVVDKVSSGEAAVEAACKYNPDLILMDIRLEGKLDGIEAMQSINARQPTPVIFVTGNSDEVRKTRIKEIEYLDFLTKPVSYRELSRSLDLAS